MYKLYEIVRVIYLQSNPFTALRDTGEVYVSCDDFEEELSKHPRLYNGRYWRLIYSTDNEIDIDLRLGEVQLCQDN